MTTGNRQKQGSVSINMILLAVLAVVAIGTVYFLGTQKNKSNSNNNLPLSVKEHTVILSTYGPSVEGSPFYETYVTKAMKYIANPENQVKHLVIVGGYTVDANRSQSQAALDYIYKTFPEFASQNIPVILEQCGVTTRQNIANAKQLLDSNGIKPDKVIVFAETSRTKKVYFFANTDFLPFPDEDKQLILKEIKPLLGMSENQRLSAYNNLGDYQLSKYTNPTDLVEVITEDSGLPQKYTDQEYSKIFEEINADLDSVYGDQKIKDQIDEWSRTAGFSVAQNLVSKGCTYYNRFIAK